MSLENTNEKLQQERRANALINISLQQLQAETQADSHNLDEMVMSLDESFEDYKRKYEESIKVIDPNVTCIGQSILTTAALLNVMEQKKYLSQNKIDINTIEDLKTSISDIQVVVAVGPQCLQVKVGDVVKVRLADFTRFKNPNTVNSQEVFELPLEYINDVLYLDMHERNLKFIYNKQN